MRIKKILAMKELAKGEQIPFGYGVAYWDYCSDKVYAYIIPLNWIIWLARELYFLLVTTPKGARNKAWSDGYQAGASAAWKARAPEIIGALQQIAKNEVEEFFAREFEEWIK